MMDPFADNLRGGDFGSAPFGSSPFGDSPYGNTPSGYYGGGDPNSPYGGGNYYDPQSPYGNYGPGGGQQYGDPANGNSANPNSPYGNGAGTRDGAAAYERQRAALLQKQLFENRWSVWQTTYGGYSFAKGDDLIGSHNTNIQIGGVIAGLDYRFNPGGVLGVAIAGGKTSWALSDNLGSGKSDVVQVGVYGSQRIGQAYVSGAMAAGWHKMSTDRTITIDGSDELRGSFSARTIGGRFETGYRFAVGDLGFTPHVAGQMLSFSAPGYSETLTTGANDFALDIARRDTTQSRTEAGVWVDKRMMVNDAMVTLRGRLAWVHEWMDAPTVIASFQTLPNSSFSVVGASPAADRVLASAGAEVRLSREWSLSGRFDGEFAKGAQNYVGMTTVRYQW